MTLALGPDPTDSRTLTHTHATHTHLPAHLNTHTQVLDQLGVKKDFRKIREEKEAALKQQIEDERANRDQSLFTGDDDSSSEADDLKALLEMSRLSGKSVQ